MLLLLAGGLMMAQSCVAYEIQPSFGLGPELKGELGMERQNRKAQAHNKCLTSELIPPLLLLLRLYAMLPSFFFCLVFVVALFHCSFFISLVDSYYTTLGFWVSSCFGCSLFLDGPRLLFIIGRQLQLCRSGESI